MLHMLGLCCVHAKPHTHIHPLVHLWTSISTKKTLHKQTPLYFPTCTHILMSPFDTPHLYTRFECTALHTPSHIWKHRPLPTLPLYTPCRSTYTYSYAEVRNWTQILPCTCTNPYILLYICTYTPHLIHLHTELQTRTPLYPHIIAHTYL